MGVCLSEKGSGPLATLIHVNIVKMVEIMNFMILRITCYTIIQIVIVLFAVLYIHL